MKLKYYKLMVNYLNKKCSFTAAFLFLNYIARCTLPERRHLVHTCIDLGVPLTIALTF